MNKITTKHLPDMQKTQTGFYQKGIEKVGVRNILTYLPIQMKDGTVQKVLATVSSYCSLDSNTKGINMSRIVRTINKTLVEHSSQDGFKDLETFVRELAQAHHSPDVYIKARFTLLLNETTPMTDIYSQEPVDITIESQFRNDNYKTFLTVKSLEMSLCPCSREMSLLKNNLTLSEKAELENSKLSNSLREKLDLSGFGAHNQRSEIQATVELKQAKKELWIEDIVNMIRTSSSCPTKSVLKRPDEKFETEVSYTGGYFDDDGVFNKVDNAGAKFVEDIARDLAKQLDGQLDDTISDYVIVVNNQESIHSGDIMATSILTAGRELK